MDIMCVHVHYLYNVLAASSLAEGANTTQQIKFCNLHAGGQHPFCIVAMLIQQYELMHSLDQHF